MQPSRPALPCSRHWLDTTGIAAVLALLPTSLGPIALALCSLARSVSTGCAGALWCAGCHHPIPSSRTMPCACSASQRALSAPSARGSAVLLRGRLELTGITKITIAK